MPAPLTIRLLLAGCACWPLLTGLAHAQDLLDPTVAEAGTFGQNAITPQLFIEEAIRQDTTPEGTIRIDPMELGTADPNTPLILEADAVTYDTDNRIARAIGDAEAFYGDRVLGADSLIYDAANGSVSATGAVALRNDDGTFLFADDASLATDLSNGTISEPRLIIAGGGKLAAVEGERVDDRYTVLSKAVYSPCDVCVDDPTPLWRVRADRVIHDEVTRDIIYQDATFDVEGVSVFYLPYFRHPDPSVERRSGFLTPEFSRDSTIGFTTKTPYFFNLAPNRDLTLTPYITSRDGPLIEAEYRARTENGQYSLSGTATYNNSLGDDAQFRGALRGQGLFLLDDIGLEDSYWGYGLDIASDDTFLRRYDYSDEDRTTSRLFAGSQTDRLFTETSLIYFQSFRPEDDGDTIPQAIPEFRYSNRIVEDPTWGIATVDASALRLERESGRDYNRIGGGLKWQRPFGCRCPLPVHYPQRDRHACHRAYRAGCRRPQFQRQRPDSERGQPRYRIRRDQPVLARFPLPRPRPVRGRHPRQYRRALQPRNRFRYRVRGGLWPRRPLARQ
jgi:LPS-assembly protein